MSKPIEEQTRNFKPEKEQLVSIFLSSMSKLLKEEILYNIKKEQDAKDQENEKKMNKLRTQKDTAINNEIVTQHKLLNYEKGINDSLQKIRDDSNNYISTLKNDDLIWITLDESYLGCERIIRRRFGGVKFEQKVVIRPSVLDNEEVCVADRKFHVKILPHKFCWRVKNDLYICVKDITVFTHLNGKNYATPPMTTNVIRFGDKLGFVENELTIGECYLVNDIQSIKNLQAPQIQVVNNDPKEFITIFENLLDEQKKYSNKLEKEVQDKVDQFIKLAVECQQAANEKLEAAKKLEGDLPEREKRVQELSDQAKREFNTNLKQKKELMARETELHEEEKRCEANTQQMNGMFNQYERLKEDIKNSETELAQFQEQLLTRKNLLLQQENIMETRIKTLETREQINKNVTQELEEQRKRLNVIEKKLIEENKMNGKTQIDLWKKTQLIREREVVIMQREKEKEEAESEFVALKKDVQSLEEKKEEMENIQKELEGKAKKVEEDNKSLEQLKLQLTEQSQELEKNKELLKQRNLELDNQEKQLAEKELQLNQKEQCLAQQEVLRTSNTITELDQNIQKEEDDNISHQEVAGVSNITIGTETDQNVEQREDTNIVQKEASGSPDPTQVSDANQNIEQTEDDKTVSETKDLQKTGSEDDVQEIAEEGITPN
ncbi:involucrin, putative [Entamoeba invadens IP1]|uniref:Involucrin, putative n=1 Tax=Entamoeba invadens IP1 TaxID=370355 RepID=A0A0A1U4E2_ENTIV|nr:involucrin, putative [Entamoeba invadens IP1]ELP89035.1 involucrin, putative [Entamoeba invadens IP1]|eukprot:XP_004255806.1 involucrin, putative [Entamoeba invadens IP1]